ncbi:MAG TPA: hypothetical protein DDY37_06975 [Legionella sp.]|nr:hypothetical protein [Legionella sp.]
MEMKQSTITNSKEAHVTDAANELVNESVKLAHELYQDGLKKLDGVAHEAQAYSDELLETVRKHPLKSILIAGGVGLLLSALLRK